MILNKMFLIVMGLITGLFMLPAPAAVASTAPNAKCPPAGTNWSSTDQWASRSFTGTDGGTYSLNANQWGTTYTYHHTLFTMPVKGEWGLCTQSSPPLGGWPYANEEKDYNGKLISQFSSLTSTFQVDVPNTPATSGMWNVAYDIGLDGEVSLGQGTELMIWVWTHNQGTGNIYKGTIKIDNTVWDLSVCGHCRRVDVSLPKNTTSGKLNLLDIIHALKKDKRSAVFMGSVTRVYGVQFGSEVHDTAGKNLTFLYQKYTLKP